MSVAIDLTGNQVEIEKAVKAASSLLRSLRHELPYAFYCDLQVQLCIIASESTKLKVNLGVLRMTGDLEQRPAEVKAETLELAEFSYLPPENRKDGPQMMTVASWAEANVIGGERLRPMPPKPYQSNAVHERFARELKKIGDDTLKEDAL